MNKKVIISLPHLRHGGSERMTTELANFFVTQDIETVVLLMYNKPKSYALNEKVRLIEPSGYWRYLPKVIYPFFLILYLRFHIKKESPNSVLAFGYKTFIFFACLNLNVRLIDSLRTSPNRIRFPNNKFYNYLYYVIRGLLNKRIDGIIAQTNNAKNVLSKQHKCEIKVIPNSVREIVDHKVIKENIILSVGRLSVEKGHRYLIEAFANLKIKNWKLKFVGEGPRRESLELLAQKLGVRNQIIFEGFQSNVDYYFQQAKIFVLPSLIEGFPNALVEAMANGLPCISFNCDSGPSEIIKHRENGMLIKVSDVEMLSQYLEELILNEELREVLAKNAKEVIQTYDISKIGQQYLDFLLSECRNEFKEGINENPNKYRQHV
jgi:glycosyltransferase involved in cell wall biosynthesis